jgi:DNA-binding HxlR family transcriptional regulator
MPKAPGGAASKPDAFVRICPSRAVLARVGEKWASLALVALAGGPVRFGDLRRRLEGVSQTVLSRTLRHLERDGLVSRDAYDERLPRVEYALTERGRSLLPWVVGLKAWAEANLKDIERSNAAFDRRAGVAPRPLARPPAGLRPAASPDAGS